MGLLRDRLDKKTHEGACYVQNQNRFVVFGPPRIGLSGSKVPKQKPSEPADSSLCAAAIHQALGHDQKEETTNQKVPVHLGSVVQPIKPLRSTAAIGMHPASVRNNHTGVFIFTEE